MSEEQEIQNQIAQLQQQVAENEKRLLEKQNLMLQRERQMEQIQNKIAQNEIRINESQIILIKELQKFILDTTEHQNLIDVTEIDIIYEGIENLNIVDVILQCLNLKNLMCIYSQISDYYLLSGLHQLKNLSILRYKNKDVLFLKFLPQLEELKLPECQIADCSSVFELKCIQNIEIQPQCKYDHKRLKRLTWVNQNLQLEQQHSEEFNNLKEMKLRVLNKINCIGLEPNKFIDLLQLTSLTLDGIYLIDISQLSCLKQLSYISLQNNSISDLSPISRFLNLVYLNLNDNQIVDLSALSELSKLNTLLLDGNQITEIKPLSSLLYLTKLSIYLNQVEEIDSLSGLKQLEQLYLAFNRISNLFALTNLQCLTYLDVSYNNISDINQIFCILHLALNEIAIKGSLIDSEKLQLFLIQEIPTLTNFNQLEITEQLRVKAQDQKDWEQQPLDLIQKEFQLRLIAKQRYLSTLYPDENFQAIAVGQHISLFQYVSDQNILLFIESVEEDNTNTEIIMQIFPQAKVINGAIVVHLPKLEELYQFVQDLQSSQRTFILQLMSQFTHFHNQQQSINIKTLSLFENIFFLYLRDLLTNEAIPLQYFKKLSVMDVRMCDVESIPSLQSNLKQLCQNCQSIQQCDNISVLSQLVHLELAFNEIDNISFVSSLKSLKLLDLSFNNITDIRYLTELKNLQSLKLEKNKLKDISSLADLTKLTTLHLQRNQIEDVRPLAGLHQLSQLYIQRNNVIDISPLAQLINLTVLRIQGNPNEISEIGQLSSLINVVDFDFSENSLVKEIPFFFDAKQKQLALLNCCLCDYRNLLYLKIFQLHKISFCGQRNPNNKIFQVYKSIVNFLIYINSNLSILEIKLDSIQTIEISVEVRLQSIKHMLYIDKQSLHVDF